MTQRRAGIFLDTGILLAAALPRDPGHPAAVRVLRRLADGEWPSAHTSDHVIAEALNFIRMKVKRRDAADAVLRIAFGTDDSPPILDSVVRIHGGLFAAALDRYRRDFDRGLSLTDWTTVVATRETGPCALATFDRGFRGLVPLVSGRA